MHGRAKHDTRHEAGSTAAVTGSSAASKGGHTAATNSAGPEGTDTTTRWTDWISYLGFGGEGDTYMFYWATTTARQRCQAVKLMRVKAVAAPWGGQE
mmetsp:Transcript_126101/g.251811  ORF Transcript_126101/g.251811 Transcript_126101/m.251811 type:complete len:97 (+) Transcript_126101:1214-1504(+)